MPSANAFDPDTSDSEELRELRKSDLERLERGEDCWRDGHIVPMYCSKCEAIRLHIVIRRSSYWDINLEQLEKDRSEYQVTIFDSQCLGIDLSERKKNSCRHVLRRAEMPKCDYDALMDMRKE